MRTLQIEIPDPIADEVQSLVDDGWFGSQAELARAALVEFVQQRKFDLMERFQREDIAWARNGGLTLKRALDAKKTVA